MVPTTLLSGCGLLVKLISIKPKCFKRCMIVFSLRQKRDSLLFKYCLLFYTLYNKYVKYFLVQLNAVNADICRFNNKIKSNINKKNSQSLQRGFTVYVFWHQHSLHIMFMDKNWPFFTLFSYDNNPLVYGHTQHKMSYHYCLPNCISTLFSKLD